MLVFDQPRLALRPARGLLRRGLHGLGDTITTPAYASTPLTPVSDWLANEMLSFGSTPLAPGLVTNTTPGPAAGTPITLSQAAYALFGSSALPGGANVTNAATGTLTPSQAQSLQSQETQQLVQSGMDPSLAAATAISDVNSVLSQSGASPSAVSMSTWLLIALAAVLTVVVLAKR